MKLIASKEEKNTAKNTLMLYILTFVKLILPLITLPYLTRTLSKETYGLVTYVKACMTYVTLIIDFGFILSSVKEIVKVNGDKEKIGEIAGHTYLAKTFLVAVSFIVILVMTCTIPILRGNAAYTMLCFLGTAIAAYIADFLFRGLEKMHIITGIFLTVKSISTTLTFILIKDDSDLFLLAMLDILSNLLSVLLGFIWGHKLGIRIKVRSIRVAWDMLKDSFNYFISNMATTVFSALNTMLIGIVIVDLKQVAYWGVCMQMVSAIQGLYTPICNGIYPHMIRESSLKFILKLMKIFMPIIIFGCILSYVLAPFALTVIGGPDYVDATNVFRCLIPVLLFSFPAQVFGWPTLGAVGLVRQVTVSTICAACLQVAGLVLLLLTSTMTLYTIAILKGLVEFTFMGIRIYFTYLNRDKFLGVHNNGDASQ